jgi:hypothetical protein
VRSAVAKALDQGAAEVTLWGATIPSDLHDRVIRSQRRLSGAAQAFKAHALAAASIAAAAVRATEDLYSAAPLYDISGNNEYGELQDTV